MALDDHFFSLHTEEIARNLLCQYLCRETEEGLTSGLIVETEAYLSDHDPACHASSGKTKRNATMFGPPARAYIYFIYGNYFCFNVVTGPEGKGEAVLIRAVQPSEGLDLMLQRRGAQCSINNLTSGPGKLCQAFAIDKTLDGYDLRQKPLYLKESKAEYDRMQVEATPRIGISSAQDKLLRFIISGNKYLSR